MNPWTRGLRVESPLSGSPKPVTLILPYYECPQFFQTQLAHLRALPRDITEHLSLVVVDDGSPTAPLDMATMADLPVDWQAFRIDRDVPWNWLAARNIGAHHAKHGWLLLTDMDHIAPAETLRAVIYGQHDAAILYAFSRREHTGQAIYPHSASFLMHRDTFWRIGGYDETLSGHYGTDGDWRRRCAALYRFQVLREELIRHEYVADSSSTTYARKSPEDALAVKRLVSARGPGWRPKTLSFPYHELSAQPRVEVVARTPQVSQAVPDVPVSFVVSRWQPAEKYRSKFGPETVNTMRRMIARHYHQPHRFLCVTDQPDGIDPEVEIVPAWNDFADLPSPSGGRNPSCYRRLRYFSPDVAPVLGSRIVSLDLDTVILDDVTPLFDRPEDFVIWGDTNPRTFYNGGLWLMTAGARAQVWTEFDPETSPQLARRAGHFGSDQGWISYCLGPNEAKWTTRDGVYSYRNAVRSMRRPPDGARLVSFHGEYDPWDESVQKHSPWIREHYQ